MKTISFIILLSFFLYADTIENYTIVSTVKKEGTIFQKETISYNLQNPFSPHGIYRFVPLDAYRALKDITIMVDGKKQSIQRGVGRGYFYIRIANAKTLKKGLHNFELIYRLIPKRNDSIILYPIGTEFRAPIRHATVEVTLPKEFGDAKVYVYTGMLNHLTHQAKVVKISPTKYLITTDNLKAFNGVTVKFFPKIPLAKFGKIQLYIYWFVFTASFVLLLYWYKFKREKNISTDELSDTIPKNLETLEANLLIGSTRSNTISAAILELAAKGYVKIKTDAALDDYKARNIGRLFFGKLSELVFKNNIEIYKTDKETDSLSSPLKYLHNILFRQEDKFVAGKMEYWFSRRLRKDLKRLNDEVVNSCVNKGLLVQKPFILKLKFLSIPFLVFVPMSFYAAYLTYIWGGFDAFMNGVVFTLFFFFVFFIGFEAIVNKRIIEMVPISIVASIMFYISQPQFHAVFFEYPFPLVLLPFMLSVVLVNHIEICTQKGLETKMKLLKLKNFTTQAGKSQIESYCKTGSDSTEAMLLYAAVFNTFESWVEHCANAASPFLWFEGNANQLKYLPNALESSLRRTIWYGTYSGGYIAS